MRSKFTHTLWRLVRAVLYYVLGTLALAIFAYALFALIFRRLCNRVNSSNSLVFSIACIEILYVWSKVVC